LKKVSVIVPVYNSENYIEKCILSIVNQTLKDIEIIIIDDGSTDNSFEIIKKYQKEYSNIIKIKNIKNSGASNARNIGIEMSEGEYIGFVDSDDYIENTMYEKLYNKAKCENSDIVICAYFSETELKIKKRQLGNLEQYGKSIKENPYIFEYGVPYIWNKIFRRELITSTNIKFNTELRIFEDLEFVYKIYLHANKISKVDETLYHYIKQNTNSLTAKFSDKFFDIIPAIKQLKKYYKENNCYDELEEYLVYVALKHIYIRCNMRVSKKQLKIKLKYIKEVFKFLNEEFPNWKNHEYYFRSKKVDKKKYISKFYWKKLSYEQVLKRFSKKISKKLRNVIK